MVARRLTLLVEKGDGCHALSLSFFERVVFSRSKHILHLLTDIFCCLCCWKVMRLLCDKQKYMAYAIKQTHAWVVYILVKKI